VITAGALVNNSTLNTEHSTLITGVILAGGQGRRMGGVDKGLQLLRGRPMVQWVIERFAPQVDEVLINANQNLETYARFGYRVIPDEISGFAGPLAGLQRALSEARHGLVATVPCDSPFLPHDLIARLHAAMAQRGAEVAVARTGDQPHPVFCLCRREVLPGLTAFLAGGGRKIDAWYATLRVAEVPFDDEAAAFSNINTEAELKALDTANPG
jgi:molybdopterin-guanine dinucleotide biosynthesis protein A